jgi:hypothetical protein
MLHSFLTLALDGEVCDTVLMGEQVSALRTVVPSSSGLRQDTANHSLSNTAVHPTIRPESIV